MQSSFAKGQQVSVHHGTHAFMSGDTRGVVLGRTQSHPHGTDTYGIRVIFPSGKVRVFHPNNLTVHQEDFDACRA